MFVKPFAYCVIFHAFMLSADFFQYQLFEKKSIQEYSLDLNQAWHFVWPDLDLNCL